MMSWMLGLSLVLGFPTISHGDTLYPGGYWALGPLPLGSREGWLDPTGERASWRLQMPDTTEKFPSPVANGGFAIWRKVAPDSLGQVRVSYEDLMDTLILAEQYGFAGLAFHAVLWTTLDAPRAGVYRMLARRTGTVWINGRPYPSNPYGYTYFWVPVVLDSGQNVIELTVAGYVERQFSIVFVPARKPVSILKDWTVPDIVDSGTYWVGLPVVNQTRMWLNDLSLKVLPSPAIGTQIVQVPPIEPLGVYKVPIPIPVLHPPSPPETLKVQVEILTGNEVVDTVEIPLRVVGPEELRRITFISKIDSSVQYYAVLPPKGGTPPYALIFALHGAGVEAWGLARAYEQKDWAYIVCPTNRRPFGFDWQDWGRLDALEVLEDAIHRFPIDTLRMHLTGHSMGGHGTWHLGSLYGWRFASMEPGAGWESFPRYIPFATQTSQQMADPALLAVRDAVMAQTQPLKLLDNLRRIPILIVQGGSDRNVPPYQPRLLFSMVSKVNSNVEYWEVPGKGHWWTMEGMKGAACVDHPKIQTFFQEHRRSPDPDTVVFETYNISVLNRVAWVQILQVETPGQVAKIRAYRDDQTLVVEPVNVVGFALTQTRGIRKIVIRDQSLQSFRIFDRDSVRFEKKGDRWIRGYQRKRNEKRPGWFGPIKEAYFQPFALVYATGTSSEETQAYFDLARLTQWTWYYRGNGVVPVIPDTAVMTSRWINRNLILFGTMKNHRLLQAYRKALPIEGDGQTLRTPYRTYAQAYAKYVYPSPVAPGQLWQINLGPPDALYAFPILYSGNGIPDFLIYTEDAFQFGWGGLVEAGFFDRYWRYPKP